MENSLSTVVKKDQTNRPKLIDSCLFVYRTTYNRSLKEIPFFLVYGRDPVLPQDLQVNTPQQQRREIVAEDLDIYKSKLLRTLKITHDKLERQKELESQKYKTYYDKSQRTVEFKIGEFVKVHFLTPEKQGLSYKSGTRWRGPFKIVSKVDEVTYRVRQEEGTKIKHSTIEYFS